MFNFLLLLLNSLFKILFSNRKDLILTLMVLKKENQIYKRQLNHKQTLSLIKRSDRFILSLISTLSKRAINHLTIIRPSTRLAAQIHQKLLELQTQNTWKKAGFKQNQEADPGNETEQPALGLSPNCR